MNKTFSPSPKAISLSPAGKTLTTRVKHILKHMARKLNVSEEMLLLAAFNWIVQNGREENVLNSLEVWFNDSQAFLIPGAVEIHVNGTTSPTRQRGKKS